MSFFTNEYSYKSAIEKIKEAKNLLVQKKITTTSAPLFFEMLEERINDFESALKENPDLSERKQIIEQYNRFAKTLMQCLSKPDSTVLYTNKYHSFNYHPVGINEFIKKEPRKQYIAIASAILGTALILSSLAAFAMNPLIGAILLPIGITLLAPSCSYLLIPEPLDMSAKKLEEQIIFQTGAELISTTTNCNEGYEFNSPLYTPII